LVGGRLGRVTDPCDRGGEALRVTLLDVIDEDFGALSEGFDERRAGLVDA
jgi:hypothetical protein